MRHQSLIPVLAAACYASLGELYFRGDRSVRDAWGECVEVPADYAPAAVAVGAAVFVLSAVLFARSLGGRWKAATALQAALALYAGGLLGNSWYAVRMARGSECARIEFCVWCLDHWWDRPAVEFILLAILGALLSLPIGWIARRINRSN